MIATGIFVIVVMAENERWIPEIQHIFLASYPFVFPHNA